MSPIAKVLFLVCNLDAMTVSLTEFRWHMSINPQTIIQEAEARGFQVVR